MKQITKNKKVKKILFEVGEIADYLWQRGWAERNAGNISVNINYYEKRIMVGNMKCLPIKLQCCF